MISLKSTLKIFTFFVFVFAFSSIAQAQATRTWVSGVGDDVNPCSRTAPCKTFAGAISKTAKDGEINCLDPGGFGAVTITKSITIDCEDTQGSILASLVNGVIVNITDPADTRKAVKLRGISINGVNTGINGVRILSASMVALDEVLINGFTQHGVSIETTSSSPSVKVFINDTHMRHISGNGINAFITGGSVALAVGGSEINGANVGVNLSGNTNASVSDSEIIGNTTGLQAFNATLSVRASTVSNNGTGVVSGTGGVVRLMGTMVTQNGTGLSSSGGSLISHISNMFAGNTTDGVPTGSVALQ